MNNAVQTAMDQLHMQHRTLGLMLGELDVAVGSLEGEALANAIEDITKRYNFSIV